MHDWEEHLRLSDMKLSRTASQHSIDTSASSLKQAPALAPEEVASLVKRNRSLVVDYLLNSPVAVTQEPTELSAGILTIASLTLRGMQLPSLYRSFDLGSREFGPPEDSRRVHPSEIAQRLTAVAEEATALHADDPIAAAALLEWEIGIGPLHPFYDACGRVSRACTALLLQRANCAAPNYPDRDSYLKTGIGGKLVFAEAYRAWCGS